MHMKSTEVFFSNGVLMKRFIYCIDVVNVKMNNFLQYFENDNQCSVLHSNFTLIICSEHSEVKLKILEKCYNVKMSLIFTRLAHCPFKKPRHFYDV